MILMFYIIGIGQNVNILSLKTALEAVGDENRPKFFKANFNPLKLTFLRFFWLIMGKIKCSLCF